MALQTLLPPNATQEEIALEIVMSHVGDVLFDIRDVKNPDKCPVKFLPWLAWEYGVTWWDEDWSEEQKREVIKNAAAVNKKRWTPGAVKQALSAVDRQVDLIEWFRENPKAAPYTFRAIVHGNTITPEELKKIISQICDAKNARSYFSGIKIQNQKTSGKYYIGGGILVRQSVTIKAKKRDE